MKSCVLVADGNAKARERLRRSLETHGYKVETGGNGLECVAKLIDRAPTTLVLDVDMLWGGADGVVARMREDNDIPVVPVILITHKDKPNELARLIKDPVLACFRKPLRMKALLEWLKQAERRSLDTSANPV